MKNYGDRGGCYPSRPWAEADNTLRDSLFTLRIHCLYNGKISPLIHQHVQDKLEGESRSLSQVIAVCL